LRINLKHTTVIVMAAALLSAALLTSDTAFAATGAIKVSAYTPIERGDVAGAQRKALDEALRIAVENSIAGIIPEKTYQALAGLIEQGVLNRGQDFIATYHIVDRDVSDRAYTVHVSVNINLDLLRKHLSALGIIKEPGSPPLASIFVTVDADVELAQVQAMGSLARDRVMASLVASGMTVVPASEEEELGFRVIRPPQDPAILRDAGESAMTDLAVGVVIRQNGDAAAGAGGMVLPAYVSVQAVEVSSGFLFDVTLEEAEVVLDVGDSPEVRGNTGEILTRAADQVAAAAAEKLVTSKADRYSYELYFAGQMPASRSGRLLYELSGRLGEDTDIIPFRFTAAGSTYKVYTTVEATRFARALEESARFDGSLKVEPSGEQFTVTATGEAKGRSGVVEFSEEVTFYRRLPVAGIENPDDVKKIDFVPWHESEDNGSFLMANDAPLGMGILAKIEPSMDHDIFRFIVPPGTTSLSVLLQHTGPGEVRPRVRIYSGEGKLLGTGLARRRGSDLRFELAIETEVEVVVLSVEDELGRYPSMFPYVLTVSGNGSQEDEPT
jgi:hypothetical protein